MEPVEKRAKVDLPGEVRLQGALGDGGEGGAHSHGDGPDSHRHDDTDVQARIMVSRMTGKPRLAKQDNRKQLPISNFTVRNSGGGGHSASKGSTGVTKGSKENFQKN